MKIFRKLKAKASRNGNLNGIPQCHRIYTHGSHNIGEQDENEEGESKYAPQHPPTIINKHKIFKRIKSRSSTITDYDPIHERGDTPSISKASSIIYETPSKTNNKSSKIRHLKQRRQTKLNYKSLAVYSMGTDATSSDDEHDQNEDEEQKEEEEEEKDAYIGLITPKRTKYSPSIIGLWNASFIYGMDTNYYILIYILLILLDTLLLCIEIFTNLLVTYIIPHGVDLFALNDWTQRNSWKQRAKALYERSAERHKFFTDCRSHRYGST